MLRIDLSQMSENRRVIIRCAAEIACRCRSAYSFDFRAKKDSGAPEEIRTPNLLIRSQMLYPVELRAREAPSLKKMADPGKGTANA